MKAYQVSDYEGHSEIVFAETPGQAKSNVCNLDSDFVDLSVRRAKDFDKYLGQEITPEILLTHGWWWECYSCGRAVYEENAVVKDGKVYCSGHFEDGDE